jgi:large subunit ribosomal protein L25
VADILTVTKREATGSKEMRRLRQDKKTPGIYYEPGKESIALSVSTKEIEAIVSRGSRDVELQGDLTSNATIKALQWDAFGSTVLHVDLTPVKSE